jgi:uncharacterized C2H2 Zn-finger protein
MSNKDSFAKCPKCGYSQSIGEWCAEANFEYNGRYVGHLEVGGDHARCPECNKLLHIDYDLIDVTDE